MCSAPCATLTRRVSSARCRCRERTRTTIRSSPFPASCRCRTSGREAAISARAAVTFSKACAIRPTCRCARSLGASGHQSRCLRIEAIDWAATARSAARLEPVAIGPIVLDVERLQETLPRLRERAVPQAGEPRGQGGRGHLVRRSRGGGAGDRRRIGLRQVDSRQGAARARDGERGPGRLRSRGDPEPDGRETRGQDHRLDPDDLPESVRHPQSELFGRIADCPHAGALPRSAPAMPSGAT